MIGLADKVPQRLAGVVGVVAVNGGLEPVVHQLLQDVSRHAGAENEKVAAHQALVDGQPGRAGLIPDGHGQVQGRTRVRDLHLPAGEHCDGAPRGLYGFDIHQNPPDRGGRPGGCRKTGSRSGSPAELRGPRPDFKMVFGNAQVHLGVKAGSGFRGHAAALKREGKFLLVHGCGR